MGVVALVGPRDEHLDLIELARAQHLEAQLIYFCPLHPYTKPRSKPRQIPAHVPRLRAFYTAMSLEPFKDIRADLKRWMRAQERGSPVG